MGFIGKIIADALLANGNNSFLEKIFLAKVLLPPKVPQNRRPDLRSLILTKLNLSQHIKMLRIFSIRL